MNGPKPHDPRPPVDLPDGVKHGGFTAYQDYGCRCEACQGHARDYAKRIYQARRLRQARKPRPVPEDKHGMTGYSYYGCRCDECRDARNSYERERRELIARKEEQ